MLSRDCKDCDCGKNPRFLTKTIAEIVAWAKIIKSEYKITNPMISQKTGVPLSTVNRFFAFEDGDVVDFKYITVHNIVTAMQEFMPQNDTPCPKLCSAENTARINELTEKLQQLRENNEVLKAQACNFEEQKTAIIVRYETDRKELKEESVRKTDYLKSQNARLRKALIIMTTLLLAVLFLIIAFLVYDVAKPEIGWFRYA